MADKSLEERISALEAQLGNKTIEDHFREQAELIDQVFVYRFEELNRQWDAKLDAKLDAKFDTKLRPIKADLAIIKHAVSVILTRVT